MDYLTIQFPSEEADSYLIPENRNAINSFFYKGGAYDKLRESSFLLSSIDNKSTPDPSFLDSLIL